MYYDEFPASKSKKAPKDFSKSKSFYPKLPSRIRKSESEKKDFKFKQGLIKDFVSKVPNFEEQEIGSFDTAIFGKVAYQIEVKEGNQGSFGKVVFITLSSDDRNFSVDFAV